MILRIGAFLAAGSTAYVALATVFWFVCVLLGHNNMEMLYGSTAVYLFTLVAAAEGACFLPDDARRLFSSMRLTQTFRSRWD
jgi:hypothetical protein